MDETTLHALGRSHYVADLPLPPGCLHLAPVLSPLAHARIDGMDTSAALALPGVKAVLSAADIVGENQIGVVFADEPLLAEGEICYAGQVLALAHSNDWFHILPEHTAHGWLFFIGSAITMMFGSIPQQDVFQRVMSAKDSETARKGAIIGGFSYLAFAFVPMFIVASALIIIYDFA